MVKGTGFIIDPMEGATYADPDFVPHDFLFPRKMQFDIDMEQIGEDTLRLTYRYKIRYWPRWKEIDEVGKTEKPLEKLPCGCSGDRECENLTNV